MKRDHGAALRRADADIGGIARQAVGGAGQRRLVGDLDRQHVDDAAAEDDDGAVADELNLLEFRGVEQDRLALAAASSRSSL